MIDKETLKQEFGGILLGVAAFFYIGSLLFYHPADTAVVSRLQWFEMIGSAATSVAKELHNPFGILGARLSSLLVEWFLGYMSVIPGIAMVYWSWCVGRVKSLKPPLFFTLYAVLITLVAGTMSGLTSFRDADLYAGTVGRMLATFLSTLLGTTGAWILLLALAVGLSLALWRMLGTRIAGLASGVVDAATAGWSMAGKLGGLMRRVVSRMAGERNPDPGLAEASPARPRKPIVAADPVRPEPEFEPEPESLADETAQEHADDPEITIREAVREKEADLDERRLKVKTKDRGSYRFPSVDLLKRTREEDELIDESLLEESKSRLLEKLRIYKVEVVRISATVGPRVTLFELELAPDVKVSKVTSLENDLAMAMAARGIRMIAPIPGKNAVGVEIPHGKPRTVWMRSVLQVEKFKNSRLALPVVLGRTIANEVYIDDLASMPHLLIAGATGAGKSVGINVIISSLLYSCSPDKVRFVLIDPKRVELFHYQHLKNHFLVTFEGLEEQIITEPAKAVYALRSVVKEMEQRYARLEVAGVRNIADFNRKLPQEALPYLVVVVDELADLMMTAGKEVEEPITRLAQLARAVGIHLIVATQRPSVDIITGVIKANFPARIAFQVASRVDSRTILDSSGADQLLGNGDMLYQPANQPKPERIQCPYISSSEVEAITSFIGSQEGLKTAYELPRPDMNEKNAAGMAIRGGKVSGGGRDPMFEEAANLVVMHQQGSVSLLQRRLKLGFSRAARVMDQLEENGIVGSAEGSKPREVLVQNLDSLELLLRNLDG